MITLESSIMAYGDATGAAAKEAEILDMLQTFCSENGAPVASHEWEQGIEHALAIAFRGLCDDTCEYKDEEYRPLVEAVGRVRAHAKLVASLPRWWQCELEGRE